MALTHAALDLTPPLTQSSSSLLRWYAEPMRSVFLPATTFIANAKGYPVLSKANQAFLKSVFKFKPIIILSGTERGLHTAGGQDAYAQ